MKDGLGLSRRLCCFIKTLCYFIKEFKTCFDLIEIHYVIQILFPYEKVCFYQHVKSKTGILFLSRLNDFQLKSMVNVWFLKLTYVFS